MKMSENEERIFVYNRLNSIYKDLIQALESSDVNQSWNLGIEEDIIRLLNNLKKAFPRNEKIQNATYVEMNPDAFNEKGQTRFLLSQVRKFADAIDFKFDVDKAHQSPQNVFNIIQNQNVTQNSTLIYENMISNINQLELEINTKQKILELVSEFKEESNKGKPNFKRLVDILEEVSSMSKIAIAMLSYWASASGIFDKILHHVSSLLK